MYSCVALATLNPQINNQKVGDYVPIPAYHHSRALYDLRRHEANYAGSQICYIWILLEAVQPATPDLFGFEKALVGIAQSKV